jgi:peptide/nickel transport system permease protein
VLTLTLRYVGQFMIVMRSSMIDVKTGSIVLARAKGLGDSGSGAITPSRTRSCRNFAHRPDFGFVLGGAIVIETVFSWPGLGLLTYQSIKDQDYPVLQAVFLLSSSAVVLANLIADITYGFLDPRSRRCDMPRS